MSQSRERHRYGDVLEIRRGIHSEFRVLTVPREEIDPNILKHRPHTWEPQRLNGKETQCLEEDRRSRRTGSSDGVKTGKERKPRRILKSQLKVTKEDLLDKIDIHRYTINQGKVPTPRMIILDQSVELS